LNKGSKIGLLPGKKFICFKVICFLIIISFLSILVSCAPDNYSTRVYREHSLPGISETSGDMDAEIPGTDEEKPVHGGTFKVFSTIPDTLNPITSGNSYVLNFLSLVYEGLVALDRDQTPIPVLSDKWTVSEDGLTWTFHIREGVKWHDGTPLTASDVEYTLEYLKNSAAESIYSGLVQNISSFAAVDASNIVIMLHEPNSFTAETMTFPVLPRHKADSLGTASSLSTYKPVGTGPYKYDSYTKDEKIILKKNGEWWNLGNLDGSGKGSLFIDEIDVMLYNNSDDAMKAFQTYDADIIPVKGGNIGSFLGRTDTYFKKITSRNFEFISFNTTRGIFSDKSARQAVKASIDVDAIIKEVLRGNAVKSEMPVLPSSWIEDFHDSAPGTGKSGIKPEEILESNGWKKNEKGYYKYINGALRYLEFDILVNSNNSTKQEVCQNIARQLSARGIKANVKVLAWEDFLKNVSSGTYEAAYMGLRIPQYPDISFLYSSDNPNHSTAVEPDSARNISGYRNRDVNNYIKEILRETDKEKRKMLYSRVKEIVLDDLPYIGLYFTNDAILMRRTIGGDVQPNTWNIYAGISSWYIKENKDAGDTENINN